MSLSIKDLCNLPSLKKAEVLAGRGGLDKIVSSISVLEYADAGILRDELFQNDECYGSEIVITGFINIKDDIDAQCSIIRRLAEAGEAGMILYYVGVYLMRVDQRMIDLCDSLDFTLICMPKGRMDLRYSEVIQEVTEAILRERMDGMYLMPEYLEGIFASPEYQGGSPAQIGTQELIKSILKDEPVKMRRLAKLLHIKVSEIDHMMIIRPLGQNESAAARRAFNSKAAAIVGEFTRLHYGCGVTGTYHDILVSFTGLEKTKNVWDLQIQDLARELEQEGERVLMVSCQRLKDTAAVRRAYTFCKENFDAAGRIFPQKRVLSLKEILFVDECRCIVKQGEDKVRNAVAEIMDLEREEGQEGDFRKTLEVFLLDADENVSKTAELMFVHRNTIKYRISRINERLKYRVTKMPEAYGLYRAAAVSRLMQVP